MMKIILCRTTEKSNCYLKGTEPEREVTPESGEVESAKQAMLLCHRTKRCPDILTPHYP